MKLRTQALLFLFALGLAPLVALLAVNVPMVLERIQALYQKEHLQNLRADFGDLDRFLASRKEIARLLAKFPEPGLMAITSPVYGKQSIALARASYTKWIDQALIDHPDIFEIMFLDAEGNPGFRLERNENNFAWTSIKEDLDIIPRQLISEGLNQPWGSAHLGRLSINESADDTDPRRYLTVRVVSPIGNVPGVREKPLGGVMITIDMGGMASRYDNTLWVYSTGKYLKHGSTPSEATDAFLDFPGLQKIFAEKTLALWNGDHNNRILWVPLFVAEEEQRLWVGRYVDPSPITAFQEAVIVRIAIIVFFLALAIWIIARWFANRAARLSGEITEGIQRMLDDGQDVEFNWRGPQELRALGLNLTRLAKKHATNTSNLRNYANQLEDTNRYKSQFLANVSHELRSPLNSILLLSKSIASGNTDASNEQSKQARIIHDAGRDLLSLIDDILELSGIESGGVVLKPRSIDIGLLLDQIVELYQPQFQHKSLPLRIEHDGKDVGELVTDPDRVGQIIKNFLSNALKFTDEGEVVVRLKRNTGKEADTLPVRIDVEDTGIGIPADKHNIVFEAFQQADGSTSRRHGGTGLGLAISLELAALLGGRIELCSGIHEGSTFSLLLPGQWHENSGPSKPVLFESKGDIPDPDVDEPEDAVLKGHSILVLDNDWSSLLKLVPRLERWGVSVTVIEDAEEAMEALSVDGNYSAVITYIRDSETDVCATILKIQAGLGTEMPFVVVAQEQDKRTGLLLGEAGVTAVVVESSDSESLKNALRNVVGKTVVSMNDYRSNPTRSG